MNGQTIRRALFLGAAAVGGVASLLCGCEGSSTSTHRNVNINVQGIYTHPDGHPVARTSGQPVTSLNLMQTGDRLQAFDNNNVLFKGSIGQVFSDSTPRASITLEGASTTGAKATIAGTIEVSGSKGVLRGQWIEDSMYSTVYGEANGPSATTNSPSPSTNTNAVITFHHLRGPLVDWEAYRVAALAFHHSGRRG